MSNPATEPLKPGTAVVNAAFAALKTYAPGSSRAALLPIDEAVVAALADKAARKELERLLIMAFKDAGSVAAREYVCSKLAMIGTKSCVPTLAGFLSVPEIASAARNALEVIPDRRAAQSLRDSLPKLQREQKVGVINSLGVRRDADSVRVLSSLLKATDTGIAGAAAAALGEIGSTRAAKALRTFQPAAPASLRQQWTDACLVCAERLLVAGKRAEAEAIFQLLAANTQPNHVKQALVRGLAQARTRE